MQYHFLFGNRHVHFELQHKDRRSLGVKVYPDGRVEVVAPLDASIEHVILKLKLKAPWILKQIEQFDSYKPGTLPRRFINGETHLYLGRQYRLKVMPSDKSVVKAYRGQLWMYSQDSNPESLSQHLDQWYKQKAYIIFNELLEEIKPKFRRYKVVAPNLTIRKMSKRWGSCTTSGKIILNTELIKAPKGCIEYVIIHELCHLVHHNHTKAFQNLLIKMMPEWRKWKDRLEYSLA